MNAMKHVLIKLKSSKVGWNVLKCRVWFGPVTQNSGNNLGFI
jgi:hypothetical protein